MVQMFWNQCLKNSVRVWNLDWNQNYYSDFCSSIPMKWRFNIVWLLLLVFLCWSKFWFASILLFDIWNILFGTGLRFGINCNWWTCVLFLILTGERIRIAVVFFGGFYMLYVGGRTVIWWCWVDIAFLISDCDYLCVIHVKIVFTN
jgi:hypothetical protein